MTHHWLGNDAILLGDTIGLELGRRSLSREGNGCENIHDEVDPEELHDVEGGVTKDKSSDDDKEHRCDINGHLELHELANVLLNVTAEPDCGNERGELVIEHDDVGVVLGSVASIFAHCKTDVGFAECARIS